MTRSRDSRPQLLTRSRVEPRGGSGFGHGVETPGGTIEPGEEAALAALREAEEETGLTALGTPELLAEDDWENRDELLRRYFFRIPVLGSTEDEWVHNDVAEGVDFGVAFRLRWVDLPKAEGLDDHFRAYLERVQN